MKERLEYLFGHYLNNTSGREEMEEFLYLVKQAQQDQPLRLLIREVYNKIHEEDPSMLSYINGKGSLILADTEPAFQENYTAGPRPTDGSEKTGSIRIRRRKPLIAAALALLVLATIGILWSKTSGSNRQEMNPAFRSLTKKMTEASEQKLLILPDSTQVWLNANSSLEFPDEFTSKQREVYLSGEAWFDVRHAEEIPFIIHTGKITTTVLGTTFNIKAYPYQHTVLISVSKGKIKISRGDGSGDGIAVLQKGQAINYSSLDGSFIQKKIDTSNIASWQQGTLYYEDETLGDILQDLQHLYNVEIAIADHSLPDVKITTSFNKSIGIKQALTIISKLIDKKLTGHDGRFILE